MKALILIDSLASALVQTWWTPVFVVVFIAILAFALWPSNRASFEEAARIPLRED